MPELDAITVRIEADLSQLRRGLAEAERSSARASAGMARSLSSLQAPAEAAARGQRRLQDAAAGAARSLEAARGTARETTRAARELGLTFASAFEDAVVEGRRLSAVLEGLERDVLRVLTRKLVTEPLAATLTGLIGGGLFGGAVAAGEFHGGGRVGATPAPSRVVPGALLAAAPRLAGGGVAGGHPRLAPGEIPAILHRGETVRTPAQEAALRHKAGGDVIFAPGAIVIQTPDPRAFAESRGQIEALLRDAVQRGRRNR